MTTPSVTSPKRVLFVCVGNSNRSQMAETFARVHGGGRVEAHSAGSRTSDRVNPRAVEFMREVGHDLTSHRSKTLSNISDVAVSMGCGDECSLVRARKRGSIPDPREMPPEKFRAVRDLNREEREVTAEESVTGAMGSKGSRNRGKPVHRP